MPTIIDEIRKLVGETGILTGDDVAARPASWVRDTAMLAAAIVRPANTEEVARVLQLCHRAGQPVVPLGGNMTSMTSAWTTTNASFTFLAKG